MSAMHPAMGGGERAARARELNSGTTKAQREAQHQIEIDNVSAQISNFFDLRKRYYS